jgi:hypothetical protein
MGLAIPRQSTTYSVGGFAMTGKSSATVTLTDAIDATINNHQMNVAKAKISNTGVAHESNTIKKNTFPTKLPAINLIAIITKIAITAIA